jgi:hypothetical protein
LYDIVATLYPPADRSSSNRVKLGDSSRLGTRDSDHESRSSLQKLLAPAALAAVTVTAIKGCAVTVLCSVSTTATPSRSPGLRPGMAPGPPGPRPGQHGEPRPRRHSASEPEPGCAESRRNTCAGGPAVLKGRVFTACSSCQWAAALPPPTVPVPNLTQ